jgi:long-chain acyl-CoA synthetase
MDFTRTFDIIDFQAFRYPQKVAMAIYEKETWTTFSTKEAIQNIEQLCVGLLRLGLKKGDTLALIGKSGSPYWNFLDLAAQKIGVIVVPILAGVVQYQMEYILEETQTKHLFFNQKNDFEAYTYLQKSDFQCFVLETDFSKLVFLPTEEEKLQIESFKNSIDPEDLATIIYTSGTSGEPKGVMLSHRNLVSNIKSILTLIPFMNGKTTLSFLPLSHVFERTITFSYMAIGANIYYSGGIEHLAVCFQSAKPHYMSCVPRVLEKMYDNVMEQHAKSNRVVKWLIDFALRIGERFEGTHKEDVFKHFQRIFADITVYRRWRKAMGGRIEGIAVGAAALQPRLSRLFSAAKIPIREGYGCSETSPVIAFNRFEPGGAIFGTVGMPIPGVEVKIETSEDYEAPDGEILVKGPNVMMGYFKKAEDTAAVFDADGWYRTGDIGHFTHKWFLKITDRKRDLFKTSTGKFVAPQVIENQLKTSYYIDQCMAYGLGKPHVVALIVPNFHRLKEWCDSHKVHWTAPQYMVINPKVEQFFKQLVAELNKELSSTEQIKNFHLCYEEWTVGKNQLTPTLKIRRRIVTDEFKDIFAKLYK